MCAFVGPTWPTIELATKFHRLDQQEQVAKDIFAMPWLHQRRAAFIEMLITQT